MPDECDPLFERALSWLDRRCAGRCLPVAVTRGGVAQFVAYVYKVPRADRLAVWFVVDIDRRTVRRVCRP